MYMSVFVSVAMSVSVSMSMSVFVNVSVSLCWCMHTRDTHSCCRLRSWVCARSRARARVCVCVSLCVRARVRTSVRLCANEKATWREIVYMCVYLGVFVSPCKFRFECSQTQVSPCENGGHLRTSSSGENKSCCWCGDVVWLRLRVCVHMWVFVCVTSRGREDQSCCWCGDVVCACVCVGVRVCVCICVCLYVSRFVVKKIKGAADAHMLCVCVTCVCHVLCVTCVCRVGDTCV